MNTLFVLGLLFFASRGSIDYDQIRTAARKGTGVQFQMFGGGVTTTGDMATYDANGNVIDGGAPPSPPTTNQNVRTITAIFDGGGSALAGMTRCAHINYGGTITQFTMISDVSGNATVDVLTVAYGSWTGPGSTSSITDSHTPSMTGATKFQDSTLTSWTTSLSANTAVCFTLSSPATITWLAADIKVAAN